MWRVTKCNLRYIYFFPVTCKETFPLSCFLSVLSSRSFVLNRIVSSRKFECLLLQVQTIRHTSLMWYHVSWSSSVRVDVVTCAICYWLRSHVCAIYLLLQEIVSFSFFYSMPWVNVDPYVTWGYENGRRGYCEFC